MAKLIEKMERETGLEPATSSLGILTPIEYKGHGAQGDACRSKQISNFYPSRPLLEGFWMVSRAT